MDTIVLDNGTGIIKAGIAKENFPRIIVPNVVGYTSNNKIYISDDAITNNNRSKIKYPLENGIIKNWEDLEKIWDNSLKRLRVNKEDYNILVTEPILSPKRNKEKISEIIFEKFNMVSLYVANQAMLSLYASGKITGIVLDSGEGLTQIVPIYEGFIIDNCYLKSNLAGKYLTDYMAYLLMESGVYLQTSKEKELCREIKEKYCYLSINYDKDIETQDYILPDNKILKINNILPDNKILKINKQRFKCPEALFNPNMLGKDILGIHELLNNTIQKCDINIRRDMYKNIILSGGNTTFKGFKNKLYNELNKLNKINKINDINIYDPLKRQYSVWIGGSILASISSFKKYLITKQEWSEYGNSIVYRI